jgi:hypothetical protein
MIWEEGYKGIELARVISERGYAFQKVIKAK